VSQGLLEPYEFGHALSDRIRRWHRLTEKCISPIGLTLGEFRVLKVLSESGPSPMVDLATDQTITPAAMTSIVDHLGELGFVERARSEYDRRVVKVSITRKGEEEVKMGIRLYKKFIEKVTAGLTSNETRSLLTILDHMLDAAQNGQRLRERR